MSTVNVKPSRSASDSVGYALYGNDKDKRTEHVQNDTNRAAAMSCSVQSPWAFVARAEALARAHGREERAVFVHAELLAGRVRQEQPGARAACQ